MKSSCRVQNKGKIISMGIPRIKALELEELNDANVVDPDDGENKAQIRLVSYSQTRCSILLREQTTYLFCFVDVVTEK